MAAPSSFVHCKNGTGSRKHFCIYWTDYIFDVWGFFLNVLNHDYNDKISVMAIALYFRINWISKRKILLASCG